MPRKAIKIVMRLSRTACTIFVSLLIATFALSVDAKTYDLVIRRGRVVDGTGNPAFFADVAVKDGRIAAIGQIKDEARNEVDARGLIVAPGFIDVHTHADDIAQMPTAEN